MGAFFLGELDADLARAGCFFLRYMDDVIVLAPTRWTLRRAVVVVNRRLADLGLERQPAKTFIGRIARAGSISRLPLHVGRPRDRRGNGGAVRRPGDPPL